MIQGSLPTRANIDTLGDLERQTKDIMQFASKWVN